MTMSHLEGQSSEFCRGRVQTSDLKLEARKGRKYDHTLNELVAAVAFIELLLLYTYIIFSRPGSGGGGGDHKYA